MAGTTEDRQLEKLTDAYIEKFRNSQFLSLFVRRVFLFFLDIAPTSQKLTT